MTSERARAARSGQFRELLRAARLSWFVVVWLSFWEMVRFVGQAPRGTEASVFLAALLQVLGGATLVVAGTELVRRAFRPASSPEEASLETKTKFAAADLARWALAGVLVPATIYVACETLRLLVGSFRNRELATLIGAVVVLAIGAVARRVYEVTLPSVERRLAMTRSSFRPLAVVPGLVLAVLVGVWAFRSSALEQLDSKLIIPALILVGYAISGAPGLVSANGQVFRRFLVVTMAAGLLLPALGAVLAPSAAPALARHGAWSRPFVAGLRLLTDFDGDGSSAWFGGGDCAPFDASVHPGAREIPRDGIDNNCRGGDGGSDSSFTTPRASLLVPTGVPPRANLVLVTIETLRADHVSWLGYTRQTTPELDELAKTSFVFEQSYAPTPTTRLSLTGLLSGRQPGAVRWIPQDDARQMRKIAAETPWLPQILRERGYLTLAVHTDFRAFTAVENAGFERGFERYDTSTRLDYVGGTMRGFPGQAQVDRSLALLDELAQRPFFLWLHLVEPHYAYERPRGVPSFGDDEVALYDAEIAEASRQVGRFLKGLAARGLADSSVVLVAGDHGEEFGEHGERFHGSNLYEAQVRTPILLRVPGLNGRSIPDAVSLVDLAPTLLDVLGIHDAFFAMTGRNLVPALLGKSAAKPGIILENFRVNNGAEPLFARVEPPMKLIFDAGRGRYELYDLVEDPGERVNSYAADDPTSARLAQELGRYLENDAAPSAGPR